MTVKELMEKLAKFDGNLKVDICTSDYDYDIQELLVFNSDDGEVVYSTDWRVYSVED